MNRSELVYFLFNHACGDVRPFLEDVKSLGEIYLRRVSSGKDFRVVEVHGSFFLLDPI